jgi:hypothetical protein
LASAVISRQSHLVKIEIKVIKPIKNLSPIIRQLTEMETEDNLSDMENIADGGAALTHAKLQYVDMTTKEREEITQGYSNIAN